MDIVMIADFCGDFNENDNNRFTYIAKILSEKNSVELITSDFNHSKKTYFNDISVKQNYKVTMLHEKSYKKNVCIKRFFSHYVWGKNIKKYLNKRQKPDIIYCAIPTLTSSYFAAKYCKKNKIKFIIDIQDLWPEAFQMVFNTPYLRNVIFIPFKVIANVIYKSADQIIAVSDTYKERALRVNNKKIKGLTVYLGTNLENLDQKLINQKVAYKKDDSEIWIGYLGTIGNSYDIKTSLEAILMVQKIVPNIKFIILGDGPLLNDYESMANDLNINAVFLGRRNYFEAMAILNQCDIALNPLVKGAAQSIINKVGDYAALGLPVINSLENREYRNLLRTYNAGINIECENPMAMKNAILCLLEDDSIRLEMGKNNRFLAEDRFNRNVTYQNILNSINN